MLSFRIKVFYHVAKDLSFTKAAKELNVSQPAISKRIMELEDSLAIKLFNRFANTIELTEAGILLFKYSQKLLETESDFYSDFKEQFNRQSEILRIAASTTISQYILPPILAGFNKKNPNTTISLINSNSEKVEKAILENTADIGLVEGKRKNSQLKYIPFMDDELIAIISKNNTSIKQSHIELEELNNHELILREKGSGTLEVIESAFTAYKIKLENFRKTIHLGSSESIKMFLDNSEGIAIISIHAISNDIDSGRFKPIEIEGLELNRKLHIVKAHGGTDYFTSDFIRFIKKFQLKQ